MNNEVKAYLTLLPNWRWSRPRRPTAPSPPRGRRDSSTLPPLTGIPLAIKDVITVEGVRTTCGSKILENYIPPYQATAVGKLVERAR